MGHSRAGFYFLLFVTFLVTNTAGLAPPTVGDVGQDPRVMLQKFDATLTFNLIWDVAEDYVMPANETLYYRVRRANTVYTSSEVPAAANPQGVPVTELSVTFAPPKEGFQPWFIEVSLDPAFAVANSAKYQARVMPGGLTVMPPILVIVLAIWTQDVNIALFSGVWCGALIIHDYHPFIALLRTLDTYLVQAWADQYKIMIILFTWFLAGLCANIYKNGGGFGLAQSLSKYAKTRTMTQLVVYGLGWIIFYDDYSNSLIVGNTMRAVVDNMFISREKFAYIVDSGSAPIASIAPISSWIGFELSQISAGYNSIQELYGDDPAELYDTQIYMVFLKSIVSRYYPWFVLTLQFVLIISNREFGPMLAAERRALYEKKLWADNARMDEITVDQRLEPEANTPRRWWNAAVPIFAVISAVFISLILSGYYIIKEGGGTKFDAQTLFSNGDSFRALLWGTFIVSVAVWVASFLQWKDAQGNLVAPVWRKLFKSEFDKDETRPIMTFRESMSTYIRGIEQLTATIIVLILAWAIALVMVRAGTGRYIAEGIAGNIDPNGIPVLTFILCAIISFATGTSWGTMAIMFPIAIPTIHVAARGDMRLMLLTISSILAGAIFGDHCTLISDTTILSALACRCDLRHHVRTQIPYAIFAATFAVLVGYLPAGFNAGPGWAWLLIGITVTSTCAYFLAVPVDKPDRLDLISRLMAGRNKGVKPVANRVDLDEVNTIPVAEHKPAI